MSFRADAFRAANLAPRTQTLTDGLADLAGWFEGAPAWTVRGLTTDDTLRAQTLAYGGRAKLAAALKQSAQERALCVAAALRVEYLVAGSVDPVMDYDMAAKFAAAYPVEFALLVDRIVALTGQGADPNG